MGRSPIGTAIILAGLPVFYVSRKKATGGGL